MANFLVVSLFAHKDDLSFFKEHLSSFQWWWQLEDLAKILNHGNSER